MRRKIKAGSTSVMLTIFVQDTSSTTGDGLSGLTHATSGLVFEYRRKGESSWTVGTKVAGTLGTYTQWSIVADGSLAGAYEIGIPNAAVAAGVEWVDIRLYGAADMLPVPIEIELDAVDYQDATAFGLSRMDAAIGSRMATYTQPAGFLASTFPSTVASTTNITLASGVTLAPTTGLGNQTADITGSLSGSVGSVASYGTLVADITTSIWGAGTRSLTTFGTLAADTATAVWANGTRTLSSFGTLVADIWASATRTLTAASDSSGITTLLTRILGTLAAGTHQPQSGDAYSRLGAPNGSSVSADIASVTSLVNAVGLAVVDVDTKVVIIDNIVDAILVDTSTTLQGDITAIKTKTDNLPADPASQDVLNNLDNMLEVSFGGDVSFNAYSLAAAKQFTSDQVLVLLSVLGIPDLGTTPESPTEGVLFSLTEELAQVIKSGEEVTHQRTGKTDVIETVTRN